MPAALVLVAPALSSSEALARAELLRDLPGIAIGVVLLAFGAAVGGVSFTRGRTRDRTLLPLALFAVLYSVRLLVRQPTLQSLVSVPEPVWSHLDGAITWLIFFPFAFFIRELLDGRERTVIDWLLRMQIGFAAFGIFAELTGIGIGAARIANNALVIVLLPGLVALAAWPRKLDASRREMRVVLAGVLVFSLLVLHANLAGLNLLPGRDLEPIGVLVFFVCLGIVAAGRTFANEQRLSAIQKELEIARRIQTAILPVGVPKIAGVALAARYQPMSEVAGDFYDFLEADGTGLGILVADVSGHGVPAALIASMLKVALSAQRASASEPARVLDGINRALLGNSERQFVTAGYAWIDLRRRSMRYAGAAHPSLLWWRRRLERIEEISENGLPLGQFDEARYTTVEVEVDSGDRLLFYTDGLPEAEGAGRELFGAERLGHFVGATAGQSTGEFADALMAEVARWTSLSPSAAPTDDRTIVVVDIE